MRFKVKKMRTARERVDGRPRTSIFLNFDWEMRLANQIKNKQIKRTNRVNDISPTTTTTTQPAKSLSRRELGKNNQINNEEAVLISKLL
jgi:hypothetical protein